MRLLFDRAIPTPVDEMLRHLDAALIRAGRSTIADPLERRQIRPFDDLLGSNIQVKPGPPVGFPALVSACRQLRHVVAVKGNVSEPLWYAMLGLVRDPSLVARFGAESRRIAAIRFDVNSVNRAMLDAFGLTEAAPAVIENIPPAAAVVGAVH